jgi:DNA-binding NtrC family response regulator
MTDPPRDAVPVFTPAGDIRRLRDIEKDVLRVAMRHYAGNHRHAAERLGIGRTTLYRKLAEYQINWAEELD